MILMRTALVVEATTVTRQLAFLKASLTLKQAMQIRATYKITDADHKVYKVEKQLAAGSAQEQVVSCLP